MKISMSGTKESVENVREQTVVLIKHLIKLQPWVFSKQTVEQRAPIIKTGKDTENKITEKVTLCVVVHIKIPTFDKSAHWVTYLP